VFRDLRDRGLNEPKLVCGDVRSARGRRCATCSRAPGSNAAGFTRQLTSSTRSASACSRGPRRALSERVRGQVPQGGRQARNGWEALTTFYLSRRALAPPTDHEPIESSFSTVKLCTKVTSGAGSKRPRRRWPTSCWTPRRNAGDASTATSSHRRARRREVQRRSQGTDEAPRWRTRRSSSNDAQIHNS
jgi:hypothetical protein